MAGTSDARLGMGVAMVWLVAGGCDAIVASDAAPCSNLDTQALGDERSPTESATPPPSPGLAVRSATRCAECHADITSQWRQSSHANSTTGDVYRAMLEDLPSETDASQCDRCHRPLTAVFGSTSLAESEGVTCDVCHTIAEVTIGDHDAAFTMSPGDNVKYGPYCDAPDHYFHKMGCSPLHQTSELCASCHVLDIEVGGTTIPVFEEYREWAGGDQSEAMQCQDCHMPPVEGEVAVGWDPPRPGVNHHGLFGMDDRLRREAIELQVGTQRSGDEVSLTVTLRNSGSAHFVPSGLPAQRLAVVAIARDADGVSLGRERAELGRALLDDQGHEVPFYRATRIGADTRIAPSAHRQVQLSLPCPGTGAIEVRVELAPLSDAIAAMLDVDPPDPIALAERHFEVVRGTPRRVPNTPAPVAGSGKRP